MADEQRIKLLMVDDEVDLLEKIAQRLKLRSFDVTTAANGAEAIAAADNNRYDVAVIDLQMPGIDGIQVLETLKKRHTFLEAIILSGHATVRSAVTAVKLAAFELLEKPCPVDHLAAVIESAYSAGRKKKLEHNRLRSEKIQSLVLGQSPLGILKALKKLAKPAK